MLSQTPMKTDIISNAKYRSEKFQLFFIVFLMVSMASGFAQSDSKRSGGDMDKKFQKATFAGGCFWCMQSEFDPMDGIISTAVGYIGGETKNPTYEEVSSGQTGHTEAIEIVFDPARVSYEKLLEIFWQNIDPTTLDQQFADVGSQYRTGIFYHSEDQKKAAVASKEKLEKSGKFKRPLVTEIVAAEPFYKAEDYHQRYYQKNADHYKRYRIGSGREGYLKSMWGEKSESKSH